MYWCHKAKYINELKLKLGCTNRVFGDDTGDVSRDINLERNSY